MRRKHKRREKMYVGKKGEGEGAYFLGKYIPESAGQFSCLWGELFSRRGRAKIALGNSKFL